MALLEKLGSFYLGKEFDLAKKQIREQPVNYDSRDLTTHAVCVGMTGSGKTGLCIDLLEEAALDGVPAIIIDPKGDITNLLLTFPELRPEDFLPWVNVDDAQRKGQTLEEYAAKTAQSWREGLAGSDQGPERIRQLKNAADFTIYTPGSEVGVPSNILSSLKAPPAEQWEEEAETLRDRIQGSVSALLALVGVQADPVRSREHILLSAIFENAWRAGEDLDVTKLIMSVQDPPFRKLGVFDLNTFFPKKDRFTLAMALNNIIASPSFGAWLTGEPLDVAEMLHTRTGKPRHSIFYIAHLSDSERMFFVTLLLGQVISWMRAQPGTTSLRAILYMDEVFGFFPPIGEPPSKRPMLTLLKQARAFGLGVMLTTQNPVDVDYRGLTNAGTWFIGKLQAERDKVRLMDGLQSAMAEAGSLTDIKVLDKLISSLDNRVFLMHNVHAEEPVVFTTRWAMSYLRGPLTKQQIKTLMAPQKNAAKATAKYATGRTDQAAADATTAQGLSAQPPILPPGIKSAYAPIGVTSGQALQAIGQRLGGSVSAREQRLVYRPSLLGFASVHFVDRKTGADESRDYALLLPLMADDRMADWKQAATVKVEPRELQERPERDGLFEGEVPSDLLQARALAKATSDLADHLYRNETLTLLQNQALKLYSRPDESERDFKVRCQQVAREARDEAVDKLRDKYEVQFKRIEEKLRREQQSLAETQAEYKGRMGEEILSGLASVAGALGVLGRRSSSLRGLSTAASKRRMTSSTKAEIAESEADIAKLKADMESLKEDLDADAKALSEQWDTTANDVQELQVSPRKTDVDVQTVVLAWAPAWEIDYEDARGRLRREAVPGYVEESA